MNNRLFVLAHDAGVEMMDKPAPHHHFVEADRAEVQLGLIPVRPDVFVRVQPIPGKGRGVVAISPIAMNAIVLCDAVERYSGEAARALRLHPLYYHLFVDPASYGRAKSCDLLWAIGAISVVNHGESPNCSIRWKATPYGEWALLRADKDILPGEEILISYTNIDEYDDRNSFV